MLSLTFQFSLACVEPVDILAQLNRALLPVGFELCVQEPVFLSGFILSIAFFTFFPALLCPSQSVLTMRAKIN